MYNNLLRLLNVRQHESAVVRKLFTIQFFLGVATAFLFTASLTLFISSYNINKLPVAYLLSAVLLIVFNRIYSYLDEHMSSPRLLQVVIAFSAVSILVIWLLLTFMPFRQLPLLISGWYLLIYMLVGYAFWGMASIIFNVRESRRLFSIVGSGDIPAKMLGYFSVTALVPLIGISNLLWVSVGSFLCAGLLLWRYQRQGLLVSDDPNVGGHDSSHIHSETFAHKFFNNRLIVAIAALSLVSYIVFAFIDFTFLSDIKVKYKHEGDVATFIAIFFAAGRFLAICFKILFSSRMIARIGLTNSLLVTPLLLLGIALFIIFSGNNFISHLYMFGFMVLITEILRSALQEPVFFILFQPLKPHDRLRGHLIAKGHTMPFALLGVGTFLILYLKSHAELPILFVAELLIAMLICWIITIFAIKKEYLRTLLASLQKGFFTGAELFLEDKGVISLLLAKVESGKPIEVVNALHLLERSKYPEIYPLLLKQLQKDDGGVQDYVVSRVIARKMTGATTVIKQQVDGKPETMLQPLIVKAYYFLNDDIDTTAAVPYRRADLISAALVGLLSRKDKVVEQRVIDRLATLIDTGNAGKNLALDVMQEWPCEQYQDVLQALLHDDNVAIVKRTIEIAGKVKSALLIAEVKWAAVRHGAYAAYKKYLLAYGDDVYAQKHLDSVLVQGQLLKTYVQAAGNTRGEYSLEFLVDLLARGQNTDDVVEALWQKKVPVDTYKDLLVNWLQLKLAQSLEKRSALSEVLGQDGLSLLESAILKGIKKDLDLSLKACSLLYDSEKVNEAIRIRKSADTSKVFNAIELLEFVVPKKHFLQINELMELVDDFSHMQQPLVRGVQTQHDVLQNIIANRNGAFGEWTRSVACYLLPSLHDARDWKPVLQQVDVTDNVLLSETRDYVLSTIK